jgi:hypothetical protein
VEKYGRSRQATVDNIIWNMHFACWLTKATDTHSEYVIFIAFPGQQWVCEHGHNGNFIFTSPLLCSVIYHRLHYTFGLHSLINLSMYHPVM